LNKIFLYTHKVEMMHSAESLHAQIVLPNDSQPSDLEELGNFYEIRF